MEKKKETLKRDKQVFFIGIITRLITLSFTSFKIDNSSKLPVNKFNEIRIFTKDFYEYITCQKQDFRFYRMIEDHSGNDPLFIWKQVGVNPVVKTEK